MLVVLAIGILLCVAGVVLLVDLLGAAGFVMRRVTTQPLGELAPGFAAGRKGFRVYATLVLAIGITCLGLAWSSVVAAPGVGLMMLGAVGFVVASAVAILGEVRTYRNLKR
jgi:hypothetical protein